MLVEKTIKNLVIQVDVTVKDVAKYLDTTTPEELTTIRKILDSKLPEKVKPAPTADEVESFLDAASVETLEYFLSVVEENLSRKKVSKNSVGRLQVISIEVQCLGHGYEELAAEQLEEYINRVGLDTAAERIVGRG
jgi:hypothetical protein